MPLVVGVVGVPS